MIKKKAVITSIQSVWVTRPTRSCLKAIRARLWPIGGAWSKFCGFEAFMRIDLFQNCILCCKYLGLLILHRNGFVFKIYVWISYDMTLCVMIPHVMTYYIDVICHDLVCYDVIYHDAICHYFIRDDIK